MDGPTPAPNRASIVLLVVAAAAVALGGLVHLREWLEVYRDIPAEVPGSALVRIGFPLDAITSGLAAVVLIVAALERWVTLWLVAIGVAAFQMSALLVLVLTRSGTVLGWSEPVWTPAATQSLVLEIAALAALAAAPVVALVRRSPGAAAAQPA